MSTESLKQFELLLCNQTRIQHLKMSTSYTVNLQYHLINIIELDWKNIHTIISLLQKKKGFFYRTFIDVLFLVYIQRELPLKTYRTSGGFAFKINFKVI